MNNWLIEHQKLLTAQIHRKNLPHALLVSGVTGAGKLSLANWLVQVLLCQHPGNNESGILIPCQQCKFCKLYHSMSYPDHLLIDNKGKTIGVDDIRQANYFLEKTALLGQAKTIVIADANKMTTAAANALLKTLEEPSEGSVILLLTVDVDLLLPTIISRCRLIAIRPPAGDALLSELGHNKYNAFANLSHLPELSDNEVHAQFEKFQQLFLGFISKQALVNQQNRVQLIQQIIESPYAIRWLEKITVALMRTGNSWHSVKSDNNAPDFAQKTDFIKSNNISHDTIWSIYQLILNTNKQLKTLSQINNQFIVEKLLVDIGNVCLKGEE